MITEGNFLLGLCVILSIVLTIYMKKSVDFEDMPILLIAMLSTIASLLLSMVIFMSIRSLDSNETFYYIRGVNIQSIKNSDEVKGHFTLGSGIVEQVEYYYYYYKTNDGYIRGKKPVSATFICEDSSEKPHVKIRMTHYESKSGLIKYLDEEQGSYKIIVPKGTLINKFEIY